VKSLPRKVFDTVSDFAANAGIVLGRYPGRADNQILPSLAHRSAPCL
jgi:2-keto-4-pentenoate hydratase